MGIGFLMACWLLEGREREREEGEGGFGVLGHDCISSLQTIVFCF